VKGSAFPAEAERKNEQLGAAMLARGWVVDHGAGAIVDLRFLAGRGFDDGAGF